VVHVDLVRPERTKDKEHRNSKETRAKDARTNKRTNKVTKTIIIKMKCAFFSFFLSGTFSSAGATKCTPCTSGTIAAETNSSECALCPSNSQDSNRTSCLCAVSFVGDLGADGLTCTVCPVGGDCTMPGTTRQNILPLPGFYAALNSGNTRFIKCLNDACVGGRATGGELCADGYTGVLCSSCSPGYGRSSTSNACEVCPAQAVNRTRIAFTILGLIIVCGVFTWHTLKHALDPLAIEPILLKIVLR